MKVVTGSEMQELDKVVINFLGISAEVLMERAGLGVAEKILSYYPLERYRKVLIICGPGNNGGDGMVCARHLWDMDYEVKVLLLCKKEKYKGEALINLKILENLNLSLEEIKDLSVFKNLLYSYFPDILVDAIFGTGLKRSVEGVFKEVIEEINTYKEKKEAKVVAVDIPSGVCAETGQILGTAVKADLTVTFELPKVGHFFYPGKEYVGKLEIVPIGFPKKIIEEKGPKREYLDLNWAKIVFKPRRGYTHKGTFGHVVILAGSRGKSGAGALCALGALKGGAGLVTLASTKSLQKIYSSMIPEILTAGFEENDKGEISYKNLMKILEIVKNKSVLVIGPGLGLSEEVKNLFFDLIPRLEIPLVIDADALTHLSENPEILKNYRAPKIITPHPGEAVRLLKVSKDEIMRDRLESAKRLSQLTDAIVVLKGPHSIVYSPDGRCGISSIDEPGLSQGGQGDILSGLIGAFIAQGYDPFIGTSLAVYLHGEAGKYLSKTLGPFGYTATEVAETVPKILKELKNDRS
ncbi:MAG: bifunctional ADP-dependent NAD(P)H-hydrate dehydratase/NAD(P)H-hydrate epimerase [Thermodesulfobacterium geofontis]|uniref:Bifunctional NAD(P)H-hydrate repair enzyme n=2 Tax=Thermodesulfobacterium geofontis TaxID=1295609 RepID=A0A2N7PQK1_9BACT|nr:MAG: bifunctional ADP-dependent NAD(P)H-hydrate dehydratase/NAD(P)H-hydrate epimerase [Thermodesulfobacterium geofontis]